MGNAHAGTWSVLPLQTLPSAFQECLKLPPSPLPLPPSSYPVSPLQTQWCCHCQFRASGCPTERLVTKYGMLLTCKSTATSNVYSGLYLHHLVHGTHCCRPLACHEVAHAGSAPAGSTQAAIPPQAQSQHSPYTNHAGRKGLIKH